jgi:hypothetical protein
MKLIDKAAVVAEIERRRDAFLMRQQNLEAIGQETVLNEMVASELNRIISFLDTIETKEEDLKKEFCDYLEGNFKIGTTGILLSKNDGEPINTIKLLAFAKHFFELGRVASSKAQKGE